MSSAADRGSPWPTVVMAVAVTLVLATIITVGSQPTASAPDQPTRQLVAYGFAVGFGSVLLLRRTMPVAVLVLSVLATFAYYTLDLPTLGVAVPVVAALFSATEAGRLGWAMAAGAVVFLVALAFRLRDDPQPVGSLLGHDAITNIALIAAAIALGYGIRASRHQRVQQARIATLTEERSALDAQARIEQERTRLSRELHDTLGHSLSVVALHAGVAAEAVGQDDEATATAIAHVRQESTASLHELRSLVRILRTQDDHEPTAAIRTVAQIPSLVEQLRSAGITVDLTSELSDSRLSSAVEAAAYRVVQESVTNVLRHADARSVTVTLTESDGLLQVTIVDDGRGRPSHPRTNGYGITGMAERVRLLGGTFHAGNRNGGGFVVQAQIPTRTTP